MFKQRRIQLHIVQRFVTYQLQPDVPVIAHPFHKALAGKCKVIQVGRSKTGLGNLHHIGKAGNEMAHRKTTLGTYAHHIANILHTFRLGQCLLYRIQCGSDARCCIIHLMRNHTDHFLVCFLFSFHHFIGQSFHQIERMLEAAVHK